MFIGGFDRSISKQLLNIVFSDGNFFPCEGDSSIDQFEEIDLEGNSDKAIAACPNHVFIASSNEPIPLGILTFPDQVIIDKWNNIAQDIHTYIGQNIHDCPKVGWHHCIGIVG